MKTPSKPTRRSRIKCIEIATGELNQTTPCRIWFSEHGEGAGFRVGIPSTLYEPEDRNVWDAFEESHTGLDEDAYEAEWIKFEQKLDRERSGLTAAQAVEWLRSKHDEAAALAKKRFEEQVSKFLEDTTECGADDLAKEGRREAKLRQIERQLIAEEEDRDEVNESLPLAAE